MPKVLATNEKIYIKDIYRNAFDMKVVTVEIQATELLENGKIKIKHFKDTLAVGDSITLSNGDKKYQEQLKRELI